jgi:hypothetical protein
MLILGEEMKKGIFAIIKIFAVFFIIGSVLMCDDEDQYNGPNVNDNGVVFDHTCRDLSLIPETAINNAKNTLHIAYNHTSHGSQLISGMDSLEEFPEYSGLYSWSTEGQADTLDLSDNGIPSTEPDLSQGDYINILMVTPWVTATRNFLDNPSNSHINVIMWSWCSINGHDAQRYVDNMEILISEYPDVIFIFMTGHAEGQSEDMSENSVHYNNQLIRQHCEQYNRYLYDFADIEAYDPDGVYYWDLAMQDNLDYAGGHNWAVEWLAANTGSVLYRLTTGDGVDGFGGCTSCAHSDNPIGTTLNCILKANAAWYMFAVLAGWEG